jgi:hypothetical protein
MFLRRILPIVVILLAGLIAFCRYKEPCIGNVDLTRQNGWQGVFDVKAERKLEKCSFVPGAYYVFSSRQGQLENWQEIMTFRHDDPIDISSENIHTVNDKVAFVFLGWKAAVTSDAGMTWNLWSAEKDIVNWRGVNYGLIEKINMLENGNGTMILDPIPDRNEPKELYTSDFGKTWKETK